MVRGLDQTVVGREEMLKRFGLGSGERIRQLRRVLLYPIHIYIYNIDI